MIVLEHIQLYMSLFSGRRDVYARRWEKNKRSGYSPAYSFSWPEFLTHKQQGGTMADFTNKTSLPLTIEKIQEHLAGNLSLGLYPLSTDHACHLIVIDFDKSSWQVDAQAFVATADSHGVSSHLEISRSGNGAHVWIFFSDWYPTVKARTIIQLLLDQTFRFSSPEDTSYDRMIPNQDYLKEGGLGNLIALPLQGLLIAQDKSIFVNPKTYKPYTDQWTYLKQISRVSTQAMDQLHEQLLSTGSNRPATNQSHSLSISLGSAITLTKSELPAKLASHLRSQLNFLNLEYVIKKKMGLSTYKTERFFKLITESAESITIPRGFLSQLIEFCQINKIKYFLQDHRTKLPTTKFRSMIQAYDYQLTTIKEVSEHDSGVIVAPPGSGKTIIGLSIIAERKLPALILVHRSQLLSQWKDRITQFLGIPAREIGQFNGVKKKLGKQITVAMMQTLARMNESDISQLTQQFGTIIIDECHHVPAKTFRAVITQLNPRYLYGLTATPQRKHHDEKLIYYYIGPLISTMEPQVALYTQSVLTKLTIHSTKVSLPFTPKVDSYDTLSKLVIFNDTRNRQIAKDIIKLTKQNLKVLVLTERKNHIDVLSMYLRGKVEQITLTGADSMKSRKEKLATIKQGQFQVLLATGQLLGEGFDLPILDALILAYPFSFEGKLIQYVGRVERGSTTRVIYDYHDELTPTLSRMFKARLRYYKKRGWVD